MLSGGRQGRFAIRRRWLLAAALLSPTALSVSPAGASSGLRSTRSTVSTLPTWKVIPSPSPPNTNGPLAVACSSASQCFAVGGGLIEAWNGRKWTVSALTVGQLYAVSCASARFCAAVGSSPPNQGSTGPDIANFAILWNGSVWRRVFIPSPAGRPGVIDTLFGVSCPAVNWCMAVGGGQGTLTEVWNGKAWTVVPAPERVGLSGVACTSISRCVAVGETFPANSDSDAFPAAMAWNGQQWTRQAVPNSSSPGVFAGVACPTSSRCVAVGKTFGDSYVEDLRDGSWSVVQQVPAELEAVACSSVSDCAAVGDLGTSGTYIEMFHNGRWQHVPSPSPGVSFNVLFGVACPTRGFCVAVGAAGGRDSLNPLTETT